MAGFASGVRAASAAIGHLDRLGRLFGGSLKLGGEEGKSLADAPDIVLDFGDQPRRQEPAGPRQYGLDQTRQDDPEALGRGEVWGVAHVVSVVWMTNAGQVEMTMLVNFSPTQKEGSKQVFRRWRR
jgi:hypothetical protein